MVITKESLLEWIKNSFKLNSYEAAIWLTLLEKGESTAGDLSKYSGVPRSRVYDILINLEKKGFIISKLTHPVKYVAIHPMTVLDNLKRKLEVEYTEKILFLEKLKETKEFKALVEMYKESINNLLQEPAIIRGRQKIYSTLRDLVEKFLDKELIISTDSVEEINILLTFLKKPLKEKENVEIIVINNDIDEKHIRRVFGINIKKKKRVEDIGRFIIIDEDIAILFSKNYEEVINMNEDVAILVRYKATILPLIKLVQKI